MTQSQVLFEAAVVGIVLSALFGVGHGVHMSRSGKRAMEHDALLMQAFVAGSAFHVLAEVLGVNERYCNFYKTSRGLSRAR